jgi:hypothetical protein
MDTLSPVVALIVLIKQQLISVRFICLGGDQVRTLKFAVAMAALALLLAMQTPALDAGAVAGCGGCHTIANAVDGARITGHQPDGADQVPARFNRNHGAVPGVASARPQKSYKPNALRSYPSGLFSVDSPVVAIPHSL